MSWAALEPLVRTASVEVQAAVRRVAEAGDERRRRLAIRELAGQLAGASAAFAMGLARAKAGPARRLALELAGRLRHPGGTTRRAIQPLLRDRTLPLSARLAATQALLRGLDGEPESVVKLLRSFAAGLGRGKAIDRFDAVAGRLGNPDAVAIVRAEMLQRQRLKCPRCGESRRRRGMIRHLWNHHQLLLEGRRARTPWQALDDRLGEPDPASALAGLHRAILALGLTDEESLAQLRDEAGKKFESLCPHCYAAVPMPDPPPLTPAELSPGRLAVAGYSVTIDDRGFWPRLVVETPELVLIDEREPDRGPTPRAYHWATAFIAGFALLAAIWVPKPWHLLTVAALVAEAILLLRWARKAAEGTGDQLDRILDHAWEQLAPSMPPGPALSRLALASVGRGDARHRSEALEGAISLSASAVAAGTAPANVLPPLWWLHATDSRNQDRDPLPEIALRLGECLDGRLPLRCAAGLLELARSEMKSRAERARLRVLGCEQAFAAHLGVWDLGELGRAFPAIAEVLGTEDLDGLARLLWVWELRAQRPWQICGPASTVFDLARYPSLGGHALATAPDLLLYQPLPPTGPLDEPTPLLLCGRGLVYRHVLLREPPDPVFVRPREMWRGGGFELRLGPYRFRTVDDPTELAERLRKWADYFLHDFLPGADAVLRYRAGERLTWLLRPGIVDCPACSQRVLPVAGRIGLIPFEPNSPGNAT